MLEVRILRSTDELMQNEARWNKLWTASSETSPLARAEMIQLWFETLADPYQFRAVVVQRGDHWVAALPLQATRFGPFRIGRLPRHPWANGGELLVAESPDSTEPLRTLITGLAALKVDALRLDEIPLEHPAWQSFLQLAQADPLPCYHEYQHSVAVVRLLDNYDRYEATLSKSHRKRLRKVSRRGEDLGELRLRTAPTDRTGAWLNDFRQGLEIEDANWKGDQGSSILRTPGMAEYFERLASLLAQAGYLELLLLETNDTVLAFKFGYAAKGTFYSHKIGYDSRYATYSPGQMLTAEQIRHFHADSSHLAIDCLSAMTEASSRWANIADPRYRVWLGVRPSTGNGLVHGYRLAAKLWRQLKGTQPYACPPLGARYDEQHLKTLPPASVPRVCLPFDVKPEPGLVLSR